MVIADGEGGRVDADGKDRRADVFLRVPFRDHGQVREMFLPILGMSCRIGHSSDNHTGAGEWRFL